MTNLRRTITRTVFTLAVAALGLVFTASSAQADVFLVNEGAILTGGSLSGTPLAPCVAPTCPVLADGITGKYREEVTFTDATHFTADIVVDFSAYTLGGGGTSDQIGTTNAPAGDVPPNEYGLYAIVTVSGTFSSAALGPNTVYSFEPTGSTATLWVDPLQNTVLNYQVPSAGPGTGDDVQILTATGLNEALSFGQTTLAGPPPGGTLLGGFYALHYTSVTLTAFGSLYYPTLAGLTLTAVASGDVDPPAECIGCVFPSDIRGDTSISFQQVPEPASLTLLGMGLLGAGLAARRRRTAA